MTSHRRLLRVFLVSLIALGLVSPASARPDPPDLEHGAVALGLALRQVGVSGRVLMVTAHPDDENNGVLVRLSRGLGLRTALLTVTRGEGGQNAIGPELFEALGVLRTGELMAMHRIDGVEQYFGRAYEFGYSFSVEETFDKWGREETLGDVVRVVRDFRPDVILTLPLEAAGGGMHHQAVARLAAEAFRAAADPARFPGQLDAHRSPWQARRIEQGGTGGYPLDLPAPAVHVPTGVYDPLLGMTWQQAGSLARSLHRCQGAGQLEADPGPAEGLYFVVDAEPREAADREDLLGGIDTTLPGIARFAPDAAGLRPALERLQRWADAARAAFDATDPERSAAPLAEAIAALREILEDLPRTIADGGARAEVESRLRDEEGDLERALLLARGVVVEARAQDGLVTPGQTFDVSVSVWNQGHVPVDVSALDVRVPAGWTSARDGAPAAVAPGQALSVRDTVTVGADARISQPYWRRRPGQDRYDLLVPADETLPWSPPRVVADVSLGVDGVTTTASVPAVFRYPGPFVGGEKRHVVQVVPALAVRVSPELTVVPRGRNAAPLEVHAFVRNEESAEGDAAVRLEVPAGFSVEPGETSLHFAYEGEEIAARFAVTPPADLPAGTSTLRAVATRGGRAYSQTVQEVAYDHIERRQLVREAETSVLALDVATAPGVSVGYVMGAGDAVADAIAQLGVEVTPLGAEDLAFGDLSRFSTIVTGIRAYETRADLRSSHPRLMRWVEDGGHLVVQYNRAAFNRVAAERPAPGRPGQPEPKIATSPYVPYPAVVTSERISDETTPVRILVPDHALLTTPNRIVPADWEGWVQERAIQLLEPRDPRYLDLIAATDPFPKNPGEKRGLLVDARVGRGTWTYVGLVLFREVPAGVPGAWRLLANLVSRPRPR
jgi:LmbE family N-acetylglucosaminyl deacetylase